MKLEQFIKQYGYAIWLGASLGIAQVSMLDWRFYLVLVPTVALVVWSQD
jgi:hypothetical protein